jgi:hypothetical protein
MQCGPRGLRLAMQQTQEIIMHGRSPVNMTRPRFSHGVITYTEGLLATVAPAK